MPQRPASPESIRGIIEQFLGNCREPALLEPGEELLPITGENYAWRCAARALPFRPGTARATSRAASPASPKLRPRAWSWPWNASPAARARCSCSIWAAARARTWEAAAAAWYSASASAFSCAASFPNGTWPRSAPKPNLGIQPLARLSARIPRHGQHGWAAIACPPDGDAARRALLRPHLAHLSAHARTPRRRGRARALHSRRPASAPPRCACSASNARRRASNSSPTRTRIPSCASIRAITAISIPAWTPAAAPRPTSPKALAADRRPPGVEAHSQARWTHQPARARHRVRRTRGAANCSSDCSAREPAAATIARRKSRAWSKNSAAARSAERRYREHPLYRQYPEAWLESQARAEIETLDASLRRDPIYGQVPAFAGGDRGVLDLLAVDHSGPAGGGGTQSLAPICTCRCRRSTTGCA